MKNQVGRVCAILSVLFLIMSCSDDNPNSIPFNPDEHVAVGNQVWYIKNLDVDHYRNGDPIPNVQDPEEWSKLTTGAWCYYENDSNNGTTYGKLYNWYAINDPRGLAPVGSRVSLDSDWFTLSGKLGGDRVAGGELKATTLWSYPNTGATNSTGFTALPGGYRNSEGAFKKLEDDGVWWTATEKTEYEAWYRHAYYDNTLIGRYYTYKRNGFSVRCVKK